MSTEHPAAGKLESAEADVRPGARWGRDRRLAFIDWRLRWDGRINRADLTAFFGISVPQASLDIARYLELAPANAVYDRSARVYVTGEAFKPLFPGNGPGHYLSELMALATGVLPAQSSFIGWTPPVGLVPAPGRVVPLAVLGPVLTALRERRRLRLRYQSMAAAEPAEREVSAHALAQDGFRWHLRAWCHGRQAFRDFVLARVLRATLGEPTSIRAEDDQAWQHEVILALGPHPALPAAARRVIELDYGMANGRVELPCREALLFYGLKRLGLLAGQDAAPAEQQIVLLNRAEVGAFLPGR